MRAHHPLACFAASLLSIPASAQVVLDMPSPPVKTTGVSDEESIPRADSAVGIAGYDTFEDEPLYASEADLALARYSGFRNFPRVTTVPLMSPYYNGSYYNSFNGPWVYPPIWGWGWGFPVFFGHGHHHHGHHHGHHHHFGGFHGHFKFGGSNFRGHVHVGF